LLLEVLLPSYFNFSSGYFHCPLLPKMRNKPEEVEHSPPRHLIIQKIFTDKVWDNSG